MYDKITAGQRLSEWIEDKGWSKSEFARQFGVKNQNVNLYLKGELDIQGFAAKLIQFGADVDYILTGRKAAESESIEAVRMRAELENLKPKAAFADAVMELVERFKGDERKVVDELKKVIIPLMLYRKVRASTTTKFSPVMTAAVQ